MKKVLQALGLMVAGALLAFGTVAQAAPTYQAARQVADKVRATISVTMLWDKKAGPERLQLAREAVALMPAGERLFGAEPFGPWSSCKTMLALHASFVQALNDHARVLETGAQLSAFNINSSMRTGVDLGEALRDCREAIEALAQPRK